MGRYITTEGSTRKTKRVGANIMGSMTPIASALGGWLFLETWQEVYARDGLDVSTTAIGTRAQILSGHKKGVTKSHQRNELIRAPVTKADRKNYGLHPATLWKYKFNSSGTYKGKGAEVITYPMNLKYAKFTGRIRGVTNLTKSKKEK